MHSASTSARSNGDVVSGVAGGAGDVTDLHVDHMCNATADIECRRWSCVGQFFSGTMVVGRNWSEGQGSSIATPTLILAPPVVRRCQVAVCRSNHDYVLLLSPIITAAADPLLTSSVFVL